MTILSAEQQDDVIRAVSAVEDAYSDDGERRK